jgi:GTPase SAR1 family protein
MNKNDNLQIFLVGEVSSGKSSLVNSLAGGYVSNSSLQRETINPEVYNFGFDTKQAYPSLKKIAEVLEKKHIENKQTVLDDNKVCDPMEPKNIVDKNGDDIFFRSLYGMKDISVIDFPGLNDSTDSNDKFFDVVSENIARCNCLVYVTKADSAFLSQSEVAIFNRLQELCNTRLKNNGQYIKICILINKFDNPYDPDLLQISEDIPKKISGDVPLFRYSSHNMFLTGINKYRISAPVPKFALSEVRKIFRNAGVQFTVNQLNNINSCGKISYKYIDIQEEIDPTSLSNSSVKSVCESNMDSSDSGSDYEDDGCSDIVSSLKYDYDQDYIKEYKGDWDKFIVFLRDENDAIGNNKNDTRDSWFKSILNAIVVTPNTIGKIQFEHIDKAMKIYSEDTQKYVFFEIIGEFISKKINEYQLVTSLMHYLSSKTSTMEKEYYIQYVGNVIISSIITMEGNLPYVYSRIAVDILPKTIHQETTECLIKILNSKSSWDSCGKTKIYNYERDSSDMLGPTKDEKYITNMIGDIRNVLYDVPHIHLLIELSMAPRHILSLMHVKGEIPYDIITKYLGVKACDRFMVYAMCHNITSDEKHVPVLFNDDSCDVFNKLADQYDDMSNLIKSFI